MTAFATIARLAGAAVVAYFGGSIAFGILADGTWMLQAALAFLPDWLFDALAVGLLWACRIGVFLAVLFTIEQSRRERAIRPHS